jgi:hypothetical protein
VNPDYTELGEGSIEDLTLGPGLYKWSPSVRFTSSVTFSGTDTDIWILQIAQDVTVGSGAIVTLAGGAKANNIFWQVPGQVVAGSTSQLQSVFLAKTGIVFQTGSTLYGAAFSQTAVTLDAAKVVKQSGEPTARYLRSV